MSSNSERLDLDGAAIVLVVGVSGAGKTTFINHMAESTLGTEGEGQACTQAYTYSRNMIKINHKWHNVAFIDTPGFDDPYKPDVAVFTALATWMAQNIRNRKITAVFYFDSILGSRFPLSSQRNFRMISLFVGMEAIQNVFLVSTHWDLVNTGMLETWTALRRKRHFERMYNLTFCTTLPCFAVGVDDDAQYHEVIARAIEAQPTFLQIQAEMEKGVELWETEAGVEVVRELKCQIASEKSQNAKACRVVNSGTSKEPGLAERAYKESNKMLERLESGLGDGNGISWLQTARAFGSEHKKKAVSGLLVVGGLIVGLVM